MRATTSARGARASASRLRDPHQGLPDRVRCDRGPRDRLVLVENRLEDGRWTYAIDEVWSGLQAAYAALVDDAQERHGHPSRHVRRHRGLGDDARLPGVRRRPASCSCRSAPGATPAPARPPPSWQGAVRREHPAALGRSRTCTRPCSTPSRISPGSRASRTPSPATCTNRLTGERGARGRRRLGHVPDSMPRPVDYDARMLHAYDALVGERLPAPAAQLLPSVLPAGPRPAPSLSTARPSSTRAAHCAPASRCAHPRVDAGTGHGRDELRRPAHRQRERGHEHHSQMVVLEHPLAEVHHELDLVTTPSGDAVAMVHCNNGASELAAWAGLFTRFAEAAGQPIRRRCRVRRPVLRGARGRSGCRVASSPTTTSPASRSPA